MNSKKSPVLYSTERESKGILFDDRIPKFMRFSLGAIRYMGAFFGSEYCLEEQLQWEIERGREKAAAAVLPASHSFRDYRRSVPSRMVRHFTEESTPWWKDTRVGLVYRPQDIRKVFYGDIWSVESENVPFTLRETREWYGTPKYYECFLKVNALPIALFVNKEVRCYVNEAVVTSFATKQSIPVLRDCTGIIEFLAERNKKPMR